mmetsp:Transcript_24592/g.41222  ORF Transcript_24592/g.41222 Transcript_24592/m.41222 type:complete len:346 (-) Transcript_24592:796-1833(-)
MVALDGIFLLVLLVMVKRIRIAVGIIKEAARAIKSMPLIIFFPIVPFILLAMLWVYAIVVFIFLASAGKYDKSTKLWSYDMRLQGFIVYHLFGLLWTNQFILAIGMCTISGAVATFYFTRDKKEMSSFPVVGAFMRTLRYHLGSLALGSLLVALVQLVRCILAYLQRKAALAQNRVLVFFFGCIGYCLACFERFLKFINRNAYIMIAMYGFSFCEGARSAMQLILKNILRVAAVDVVGDYILFLGKLAITFSSGALCFLWLSQDKMYLFQGARQISSPILPIIVVVLASYVVSSAFLGVFSMAIDTILLCFCQDCEKNSESGNYYASEYLRQYISNSNMPPKTKT